MKLSRPSAGIWQSKGKFMGCDIHAYIEVLKKGEWRIAGRKESIIDPMDDFEDEFDDCELPIWRDYTLFSILANVRNNDYESIEPIDYPRGLPEDISNHALRSSEQWDSDGHGHSWLLLSEILGYKWRRKISYKGKGYSDCKSLKEWCFEFWLSIIPFMKAAKKESDKHTPNEVRLVFWFDN